MRVEYKYHLEEELLTRLNREFDIQSLVNDYVKLAQDKNEEGKEKAAEEIFGKHGRDLAERIMQIEEKYRDRGAELVYEVAQKTGLLFPSVPQRLLEIALLSVRPDDYWDYLEISHKRLAYQVKSCTLYQALKDALGDLAAKLPCRHACLGTSRGFYEALNLEVDLSMLAELPKDGRCQFDALIKG